jgi:hypothetical protein
MIFNTARNKALMRLIGLLLYLISQSLFEENYGMNKMPISRLQ